MGSLIGKRQHKTSAGEQINRAKCYRETDGRMPLVSITLLLRTALALIFYLCFILFFHQLTVLLQCTLVGFQGSLICGNRLSPYVLP